MLEMQDRNARSKCTLEYTLEYKLDYDEILNSRFALEHRYLQDIRGLGARAERLRFEITSTEKLVTLELDAVRNRLLQVDLALESMTMTIGFGAMIAGLFGMNLKSGKETTDGWFWGICILVFGLTVVVPPFLLALFRYWFGYFSNKSAAGIVVHPKKLW